MTKKTSLLLATALAVTNVTLAGIETDNLTVEGVSTMRTNVTIYGDIVYASPIPTNGQRICGRDLVDDGAKLDALFGAGTSNSTPLYVGTPTNAAHAANSAVLDDRLAAKADAAHTHNASDVQTGTLNLDLIPASLTGKSVGFLAGHDTGHYARTDVTNIFTAGLRFLSGENYAPASSDIPMGPFNHE